MNTEQQITLAIESAIRGGSVSLIADGREIANWIGSADVSKAEELLVEIDLMLGGQGLTISNVSHVAVSAGPGSFTGIRIGIATALGLKAGLGIPMSSISALEAIALHFDISGEAVIAVPVGRNAICRQRFARNGASTGAHGEPETVRADVFGDEIAGQPDVRYILHGSLCDQFGSPTNAVDLERNIAFMIGMACDQKKGIITEPLFINKGF